MVISIIYDRKGILNMIPVKIPKEEKDLLIERIQHYYQTERGEEIGGIAAEGLLNFFVQEAAPYIYNQAIKEARQVVLGQMGALEEELYSLEKPI
jgi:uncharacterized protein (DUF2164 family)